MLVAAAVGAVFGFVGMRLGATLPVPSAGGRFSTLWVLPLLPVVWLVVVGFHELGHLVGGWATGGRFLLWVVGPLKIQRTPSGIHVGWNKQVNLTGGLAACLPLDAARITARRTSVMVAGGPFFSLLLTVALAWVAVFLSGTPGPIPVFQAGLQHLALATAGLSAAIFVVTCVPTTVGGFKSDGARFLGLLRGDHRSDQESAMIALTAAGLGGVRPADLEPTLLQRSLALRDGSLFDTYAHVTAFYHAADSGHWTAAQQHLDTVIDHADALVPYVRDCAFCDYAWLLATQSPHTAAARAWLNAAGPLSFEPATRLRAEAAVLHAEGDHESARAKALAGLEALERKSLAPVRNAFAYDALTTLAERAS